MGHHLFPVPFNFPVPGHQVRHSALAVAALKCLPTPCTVGLAMKSHDAPEKSSRSLSGKWVASQQPMGRRPVNSCSVPVGSRVQFEGKGGRGTHRGGDSLMFWWFFFFFFGRACGSPIRRSRQQRWEMSMSAAWFQHDRRPHGWRMAPSPTVVHSIIHTLLHQLMDLPEQAPLQSLHPEMEPVCIFRCVFQESSGIWSKTKSRTDLRRNMRRLSHLESHWHGFPFLFKHTHRQFHKMLRERKAFNPAIFNFSSQTTWM